MLKQWCYNQVLKLVLHRYLLYFSLGICVLILFSNFWTQFSHRTENFYINITHPLILASSSIFYIFSKNFILSELHGVNLKLCSKKYKKIVLFHLIVAPKQRGGWWYNYSTKTRQMGQCQWVVYCNLIYKAQNIYIYIYVRTL